MKMKFPTMAWISSVLLNSTHSLLIENPFTITFSLKCTYYVCTQWAHSFTHQLTLALTFTQIPISMHADRTNERTMNSIPVFICSLFSLAFSSFRPFSLSIDRPVRHCVCSLNVTQQWTNGHIRRINAPPPTGGERKSFSFNSFQHHLNSDVAFVIKNLL